MQQVHAAQAPPSRPYYFFAQWAFGNEAVRMTTHTQHHCQGCLEFWQGGDSATLRGAT